MTDEAMSPLRRRMIEQMTIRPITDSAAKLREFRREFSRTM